VSGDTSTEYARLAQECGSGWKRSDREPHHSGVRCAQVSALREVPSRSGCVSSVATGPQHGDDLKGCGVYYCKAPGNGDVSAVPVRSC